MYKTRNLCLLAGFLLFFAVYSRAQWTNLNANLPGNLKAVSFRTTNIGLVGGSAGIYYTSNGGTNWQRVNPTGPAVDTMVFHFTDFKTIFYYSSGGDWLAGGNDTVQNKAVIFKINAIASTCALVYTGAAGTTVNDIKPVLSNYIVAVGNGGLARSSTDGGTTWAQLPMFVSVIDLYALTSFGNDIIITGNTVTYSTTSFPSSVWTPSYSAPLIKKIVYGQVGACGVGTTVYGSTNLGNSWQTISNYNSYPLNGRSVVLRSSTDGSIATDHGIYRSVINTMTWEFQASSNGYVLNDLSFPGGGIGYAAGISGVVLKTTNDGGPSLPYINYTSQNGGCLDSTIQFTNQSPGSYVFKWKNNGTQFASTYNSSYTFSSLGSYNIRLVGTNVSLSDSVTYIMQIVNLPNLNVSYTVSDTLLCKSGSSVITIQNSDAGVNYRLYRMNPVALIDQVAGNGGNVVLNTGTITDSTYYRIKAVSAVAECGAYLPDTILIGVEKTKAAFHSQLINADIGEPVNFIENCTQAAYFNWSFGMNATPPVSVLANPSGVTYSSIGQTSTTLIATSLYGCIDTVTANGPYIFDNADPALNTSCWALSINGQNPGFSGETESANSMDADLSGNLLVSGRYTNAVFNSRAGVSYGRTANSGMFIANYNPNGVLKWLIRSGGSGTTNNTYMADAIRAADGSFYATGYGSVGYLHTNSGDSINIGNGSFVFHFDSLGSLLWYSKFNLTEKIMIDVDQAGNVYVTGQMFPSAFYNSVTGLQTIPAQTATFYLAKIDQNGSLSWITRVLNTPFAYMTGVNDIAVDNTGHLYITGTYGPAVTFYSVSGGTIVSPPGNIGGSGCDLFVAKYTTAGNVVWLSHATTTTNSLPNNTFDYGICIDTDPSGNIYFSGQNDDYYAGRMFDYYNPQGIMTQVAQGELFYAALDSAGDLRWTGGTKFATAGRSNAIRLGKNNNVLGSAWLYDPNTASADFTSANNTFTTLPVNNSSFYFTSYDTSGVLNFVNTETGITPSGQGPVADAWGIDDDTAGNVFVAGGLQTFNSIPTYPMADTALALDAVDGFIAKLGSGCIVPNIFSVITGTTAPAGELLQSDVFPNPGSGQFTVNCTDAMEALYVRDMPGRLVAAYHPGQKQFSFVLDEAGIYLLEIHSATQKRTAKIIVRK